jgi:hypothetical protein
MRKMFRGRTPSNASRKWVTLVCTAVVLGLLVGWVMRDLDQQVEDVDDGDREFFVSKDSDAKQNGKKQSTQKDSSVLSLDELLETDYGDYSEQESGPSKLLPEDRAVREDVCGVWQEVYARKHAETLRQAASMTEEDWKKPNRPRFAVFRCRQVRGDCDLAARHDSSFSLQDGSTFDQCGGLADRLAGIVSTLAFALVTDRAFLIDWPGVEAAFSSPFINFTWTPWAVGGPAAEKEMPPMPPTAHRPYRAEMVISPDRRWGIYNFHDCEVRARHSLGLGRWA